jgi:hypothetical protein
MAGETSSRPTIAGFEISTRATPGISASNNILLLLCAQSNSYKVKLQKQHSVNNINYITDEQKHKDNRHKATLENNTTEEQLFLPYTTKTSTRTIRTRRIISVNSKVVLRKPIKVINNNNN